jgi:hypothetical protein
MTLCFHSFVHDEGLVTSKRKSKLELTVYDLPLHVPSSQKRKAIRLRAPLFIRSVKWNGFVCKLRIQTVIDPWYPYFIRSIKREAYWTMQMRESNL